MIALKLCGEHYGLAAEHLAAAYKLTKREGEIVRALISGPTKTADVARALKMSAHTVNNHLKSIFEKTSTASKIDILQRIMLFQAQLADGARMPPAELQLPGEVG